MSARNRPNTEWDEDAEVNLATSMAFGLLSGALKYGMYLTLPLHVAMLTVGFIHRDECPVNRRIPWYLMFGGAAGIMTVVLRILMIVAWSCIRGSNKNIKYHPAHHPALAMVRAVTYLFRLFVVAWNISATFHIYKVVPVFNDPTSPLYCQLDTYYLAYVLVILFDVFSAIVIIVWLSALVAGICLPEMVENLYDNDNQDAASLPDLELDENSLMDKQRQRRRKRKQKLRMKLKRDLAVKIRVTSVNGTSCSDECFDSQPQNGRMASMPETTSIGSLPVFGDKVTRGHKRDSESDDISSTEDKNILSSVRFSRLVDSRRISKDYYSKLQQQQQQQQESGTASSAIRYTFPSVDSGIFRLINMYNV
jgi:hypothetical protein